MEKDIGTNLEEKENPYYHYRFIPLIISGILVIIILLTQDMIHIGCSENVKDMSNLELIAINITKDINSFYKHNLSKVGVDISDEELKTAGGVCWNYAQYAEEQAKKQGVYATIPTIYMTKNKTHAFTIISNNEGFCIIDQWTYECMAQKNSSLKN